MAIAVVQTTAKQQGDGVSSLAFNITGVVNGNALITPISVFNNSTEDLVSVSDGTAFTRDKSSANSSSASEWVSCYSRTNVASGTHSITLTADISGAFISTAAMEVSGLQATPFDQAVSADGSVVSGTTSLTAPSQTPTTADSIIVVTLMLAAGDSRTITGPTGYTNIWSEVNASSHQGGGAWYKIRTTAGAEAPSVSWTGGGADSELIAVIYKGAAAGFTAAQFPFPLDLQPKRERPEVVAY